MLAWDRGPAVPLAEHHDEKALLQGVLGGAGQLACARCNRVWSATPEDIEEAREANDAWLTSTYATERVGDGRSVRYVPMARSRWEAKKLANEAAKVERLKEGRW